MSEKESHLDQKPPLFASTPQMTGKQQPQQMVGNHSIVGDMNGPTKSANPLSAYGPSLPQKGKLILPTALWILIVVAGFCFLSLLGSLNKTMKTLDTLVEIERESAKSSRHHEENADLPKRERLELNDADDSKSKPVNDDPWFHPKASWFSLPKWTSLESDRPSMIRGDDEDPKKQSVDEVIKSAVDEMFSSSSDESRGPIKGRIIIASGVHNIDDMDSEEPMSLFDSLFKHPLNSIKQIEPSRHDDDREAEIEQILSKKTHQEGVPFITANVDNLNIHINSDVDDDEKPSKKDHLDSGEEDLRKIIPIRFNTIDDEEPIRSSPLDNLISRLMDPTIPIRNVAPKIVGPIEEEPSILRPPMRLPFQGVANRPEEPPVLRFLIPLNLNSDEPQIIQKPPEFGPRPMNHLFSPINIPPPMSDERPKVPFSPYELDMQPMDQVPVQVPPKHKSQMDVELDRMASEFAQALSDQGITNEPTKTGLRPLEISDGSDSQDNDDRTGKNNKNDDMTVIRFNGDPLINDQKKQSLAQDEETFNEKKFNFDNQFNNLFHAFFGPPPKSKLVVKPEPSDESWEKKPSERRTTEAPIEGLFNATTMSPEELRESTESPDDVKESIKSTPSMLSTIDLDPIMDSILGSMSTAAQQSDRPAAAKVEDDKNETDSSLDDDTL